MIEYYDMTSKPMKPIRLPSTPQPQWLAWIDLVYGWANLIAGWSIALTAAMLAAAAAMRDP